MLQQNLVLLERPLHAGPGCMQVVLLRQAKPSGRLVVLVQALTAPKLAGLESAPSSVPAPIQVPPSDPLTAAMLSSCTVAKPSKMLGVQSTREWNSRCGCTGTCMGGSGKGVPHGRSHRQEVPAPLHPGARPRHQPCGENHSRISQPIIANAAPCTFQFPGAVCKRFSKDAGGRS